VVAQEDGCRGGMKRSGGAAELLARVGSRAPPLVDLIGPLPPVDPGRWDTQETTLAPARLSSNPETTPRLFTPCNPPPVVYGYWPPFFLPLVSRLRSRQRAVETSTVGVDAPQVPLIASSPGVLPVSLNPSTQVMIWTLRFHRFLTPGHHVSPVSRLPLSSA
jgi:hypothetical protein